MTKFTKFRVGQLISQIGDYLTVGALSSYILTQTNDPGIVSIFYSVSFLFGFLIGLFLTSFLENYNYKNSLVVIDGLRAIIYFIFAALVYFQFFNFDLFMFLMILNIILLTAFSSLSQLFQFSISEDKSVYKTIKKTHLYSLLSQFVGLLSGVLFIKNNQYSLLFFLNAVSFVIASFISYFVHFDNLNKQNTPIIILFKNILTKVKFGFSYLLIHSESRLFFIILVTINFATAPMSVFIPKYVHQFQIAHEFFNYHAGFILLGQFVGNLLSEKTSNKKMISLISLLLVFFLCFFFENQYIIMFSGFLFGFGSIVLTLLYQSKLIQNLDIVHRGRVSLVSSLFTRLSNSISTYLFTYILK